MITNFTYALNKNEIEEDTYALNGTHPIRLKIYSYIYSSNLINLSKQICKEVK